MDREEFLRWLGTEPRSEDPDYRAARRESIEFAQLARESDDFEERLERAFRVPVDPELEARILERTGGSGSRRAPWPMALAMAATVVLAVSLAVFLPRAAVEDADTLGAAIVAAFVEHLTHDERGAFSRDAAPLNAVVAAMAEMGADPGGVPGEVTYVYPCPIGGERGLHLVMTNEAGERVTVLYQPDKIMETSELAEAPDGAPTLVFGVPSGAVAVVAHAGQDPERIARDLFSEGSLRIAGSS